MEGVQLIFLSNIRRLNKSINSNIQVFTTTFRYMHIMYYICISIHTYGLVKYNMSNENYYIRNKVYIYCNNKDNTVIPKREVYIIIGV